MLEHKITELSKKIVLAATGIALNLSCVPSLIVPTQVLNQKGEIVSTGINCCSKIDCSNYDYCRVKRENVYNGAGVWNTSCECEDFYVESKSEPPGGYGPK